MLSAAYQTNPEILLFMIGDEKLQKHLVLLTNLMCTYSRTPFTPKDGVCVCVCVCKRIYSGEGGCDTEIFIWSFIALSDPLKSASQLVTLLFKLLRNSLLNALCQKQMCIVAVLLIVVAEDKAKHHRVQCDLEKHQRHAQFEMMDSFIFLPL
jgi:hypothetical protein